MEEETKKEKRKNNKIKAFIQKNSIPAYTSIGIAAFFLAVMITAQVTTMSKSEEVLKGKREGELADSLVSLQRDYDELKAKYDESQEIVEEYQTNSATNDSLIASMKNQINTLSLLAGTTDVQGEGIIITLYDGNNSGSLVHDSDVLTVVNELRVAGAEAISVNDQRIITTSAIRCVGSVIQVNYQKVAAPFEIKAIGNAQYLESALTIKNGVVDVLNGYGLKVTLTRESDIKIPKYDGVLSFNFAKQGE
ncbi:MAG: DUF881 domain-containing protein [Clostridia bacterium]